MCSTQFANLYNFEIVLCKLEIVKLQTNFEICAAILSILEIAQEPTCTLIVGTRGLSSIYIPNSGNHFFIAVNINEETYAM